MASVTIRKNVSTGNLIRAHLLAMKEMRFAGLTPNYPGKLTQAGAV